MHGRWAGGSRGMSIRFRRSIGRGDEWLGQCTVHSWQCTAVAYPPHDPRGHLRDERRGTLLPGHQASARAGARCQVSGSWCQSGVYQVSGVLRRVLGVRYNVLGIRYQVLASLPSPLQVNSFDTFDSFKPSVAPRGGIPPDTFSISFPWFRFLAAAAARRRDHSSSSRTSLHQTSRTCKKWKI